MEQLLGLLGIGNNRGEIAKSEGEPKSLLSLIVLVALIAGGLYLLKKRDGEEEDTCC